MERSTVKMLQSKGFRLTGAAYQRDNANGTFDSVYAVGSLVYVETYWRRVCPILASRCVFHEIDECDDLTDHIPNLV